MTDKVPTESADTDVNAEMAELAKDLNLADVKTALQLPENSDEKILVVALLQIIGALQAKYDALVSDQVAQEEVVTNRILDDYKDIIPNDQRDFWFRSLIQNRDETLTILNTFRPTETEPAPRAPDLSVVPKETPPVRHLANRNTLPKSVEEISRDPLETDARLSAKIRNRAHTIRQQDGISFHAAWARAEAEIIK